MQNVESSYYYIAVIYCGPTEWRFERRRGSSVDRKNTVRHLIQMMAIHEEEHDSVVAAAAAAAGRTSLTSSLAPGDDATMPSASKPMPEGIPIEFQVCRHGFAFESIFFE